MNIQPTCRLRPARPDDACAMAGLIQIAGEGIPTFLWSQMARAGESPLEVGEARARRDKGGFSYRNAVLAEFDGEIAGMMLGYVIPEPSTEDRAGLPDLPPLLRPLIELEYEVPGSFYINALAVRPEYQGRGIGTRLIAAAAERGRKLGAESLSLQVFSQNCGAKRLYIREGFTPIDERPIVPHSCYPYDDRTLLLTREI